MDSRRFFLDSATGNELTPDDLVAHCDHCQEFNIPKTRDIAIFIDGACPGNGTPDAKAGIGVNVYCDSNANISKRLQGGPQTSQRAEIQAAIAALIYTRRLLRQGKFKTWHGIVLITDSAYLINAMTSWIHKWNQNGWKNSSGKPVVNEEDFKELENHILYLEKNRVRVRFWKVDRKFNTDADELAKQAVKSP